MKDLWEKLKNSNSPIVLYGMGDGAEKIISVCNNYGIKISGVFASDGFVRPGKIFMGFPVVSYSEIKARFPDMTVLVAFGTALFDVIDNIKRIGSENTLYVPDVPVWGGPVFNLNFFEENAEKINTVYKMLSDSLSRKCFINMINYKLSGKPQYLFDSETPKNEIRSFLKLSDKETYLDLGAYRGDTVTEFINTVKDYRKIIAVEPDKKTYNKLLMSTANLKNFTAVLAAVSDADGTVGFTSAGSRGSGIGEGSDIQSVTVDTLCKDGCSFIKMDVEGAELAAIKGARKTIEKYRPKMQIAAYHKSEDIFEICLKVKEINPNYKVYLRHFPCLPGWDTNFFFT